ncbi:unnamed protein product, partial [marine sediment metagenome]
GSVCSSLPGETDIYPTPLQLLPFRPLTFRTCQDNHLAYFIDLEGIMCAFEQL